MCGRGGVPPPLQMGRADKRQGVHDLSCRAGSQRSSHKAKALAAR